MRVAITPVFVWILLYQPAYLAVGILLFTIAALSDSCDGYVARRYGLVTEFGNFLDPFADKVLIFSTFFSFYVLGFFPLWFVLLVIIRDSMITVLRLAMVNRRSPLKTSSLGKWKTTMQIMLIYSVFLLMLLGKGGMMAVLPGMVTVLIYVVAVMTAHSGVQYLVNVIRS